MSEKANETVDDFIKLCVSGLSREYAEALAGRAYFTTTEWLRVYDHCQSDWSKSERCFNMQVIAMKKGGCYRKDSCGLDSDCRPEG